MKKKIFWIITCLIILLLGWYCLWPFFICPLSSPFLQNRVKTTLTRCDIRAIESHIEEYHEITGKYPNTLWELQKYMRKQLERIGFISPQDSPKEIEGLLKGYTLYSFEDAWHRKLVYKSNGNTYKLYSVGRDGKDETGDEIFSYDLPGTMEKIITPSKLKKK